MTPAKLERRIPKPYEPLENQPGKTGDLSGRPDITLSQAKFNIDAEHRLHMADLDARGETSDGDNGEDTANHS
ncbi:MAG: hypothetical protein V1858_04795 [Candidatus Gottesmanbacteria bacterium]